MAFTTWGLVLAVCVQAILAADFDYEDKGPAKWATLFPKFCDGKSQSPIDLKPGSAKYDSSLGKIKLTGYEKKETFDVSNNGHSFVVVVRPDTFSMSEGGLPGTFKLHSFHLHWGSEAKKGSEHTVDGKMYPAELHLVHYNSKYANLSVAVTKSDGLAVLGIFYQIGNANAALGSFLKYTANVTKPKDKLNGLSQMYSMDALLPTSTAEFYRYNGGLTTPNCSEVVTWTVFKTVNTISNDQLELLRGLEMANGTKMVDNYRPPQPLNDRTVSKSYGADSGANYVTNQVEVIMALVLAFAFRMLL